MTVIGERLIIDSRMTLQQALSGKDIPHVIRENQVLVPIEHLSFDGRMHRGQLVVHREMKRDIQYIFDQLRQHGVPIEKIIPIVELGWDDDASMAANHTTGFNPRNIIANGIDTGRPSAHGSGKGVDINPLQNPCIRNGIISPPKGRYEPGMPGTITWDSLLVRLFKERGFTWGGDWQSLKDYMHFERL